MVLAVVRWWEVVMVGGGGSELTEKPVLVVVGWC